MISLQEMANLSTLYNQKHRHYHDIRHVQDCLVELENFCHPDLTTPRRNEVQTAIWYHDAVYNPYSSLNEYHSWKLAEKEGHNRAVIDCIIYTKFHLEQHDFASDRFEAKPEHRLAIQVMLDIDLSGFGKPWHICRQNSEDIRKEHYKTTDREFYLGRLNFLETLMKRECLYYTNHFKQLYHEQSRKNLLTELQITLAQLDVLNLTK